MGNICSDSAETNQATSKSCKPRSMKTRRRGLNTGDSDDEVNGPAKARASQQKRGETEEPASQEEDVEETRVHSAPNFKLSEAVVK